MPAIASEEPEDRGCWAPRQPSGQPAFGEDEETARHGDEPSGEEQDAEEPDDPTAAAGPGRHRPGGETGGEEEEGDACQEDG